MAKLKMSNPEIGHIINAGGVDTNLHDMGPKDIKENIKEGADNAAVFLHGSGPGVSAWANWRANLPIISQTRRVIAPDIIGFGYTKRPADNNYNMALWRQHLLAILDTLELNEVDLIGNSFGGALALSFAVAHPARVRRLVLMGSGGLDFELTKGLDRVWGYQPSAENMQELLDIFAFNKALITPELVELRYKASIQPGFQESYGRMFPAPRQEGIRKIATDEADIRSLKAKTLIIHGQEDKVIPVSSSLRLLALIEGAELHIFRNCGHWTQIEYAPRFNNLVEGFLSA
ncbi:MAG: alpha/beta hydrolase [Alphaproteobacteria bacterium]|nr:alpha/beta hydrolase [Alphaproteobacteria bacterium]